jgi:predicted dehydrogenase
VAEPVYVAVLGSGSIGIQHLGALRQIPGVQPLAIPTRPERTTQLEAAGYVTAKDLSEAARMGATLCIVATDTGRHVQDALCAAETGLDVLVEKPLSTDAGSAYLLCRQVMETGRRVFVGYVLRFSESLNRFRELLGKIGRLHSVRIECQSYLPDRRPSRTYRESYSARADEGGVLRDLSHEIDYAGWLVGWPAALQAKVRNLGRLGIAADEAALLVWETPDNCLISSTLDYLTRPTRRRMVAAGELGTIEWDGVRGTVALALASEPAKVMHSTQTRAETLRTQDRAFLEASCGALDPRLASDTDGINVLAVCDTARLASETRREEKVNCP